MFLCKSFQVIVEEFKYIASVLMSTISPVVPGLVACFVILVVVQCCRKRRSAPTLDIPGPFYFPFIGCMYLFRLSASPHKTLSWLTRIYGNVYSMNLAGRNVVIVNSMEYIKEVLYQKSRDFAGRPDLFSLNLFECSPIMLKDYSSEYLQQKHIAKSTLQKLMNHEDCIIYTARKAIKSLHESFEVMSMERKTPFNPNKAIREMISDAIMDCLFGSSISRLFYHEARAILEQASTMYVNTCYVGTCRDFLPLMRYLTQKKSNLTKLCMTQLHDFVRKVYQVHHGSLLHNRDYTSNLAYILREHKQNYRQCDQENLSDSTNSNENAVVSILCEILFNAYEKMSVTFSWCVAQLANNPGLQQDIQEELFDADYMRDGTRLLNATINEVLRTSCVLPLCIPRRTTRDTTLNGYHIPEGTIVLLNLWSCCNDEKLFSSPQQFNPYRFVPNENSESGIAEEFPPCCSFSGGERKCLGDTLTRKLLVSLTGGMLSTYDIELATPKRWKSLERAYGWTLRPGQYTIYINTRKTNGAQMAER